MQGYSRAIVATVFQSFQTFNNAIFTTQTLYVALFALFSGFLSAGLVSSFIPLVETLFQYTTNIKLLELANLNSPVLRELMVKAPGTRAMSSKPYAALAFRPRPTHIPIHCLPGARCYQRPRM